MAVWGAVFSLTRAHPNRAQRGLYGGTSILYGNNVSFSNRRTRRRWLPNVHRKNIYSEILQKQISIRLTTNVLREIDRRGGLDNYLLYTKESRIDSEFGMKLREQIVEGWEKINGKKFTAAPVPLRWIPKL